jgi:hypothetical protein
MASLTMIRKAFNYDFVHKHSQSDFKVWIDHLDCLIDPGIWGSAKFVAYRSMLLGSEDSVAQICFS